jgi:Fe-S-cluster containining protein
VRCGACCTISLANVAEGYPHWVEIERGAPILGRKDLVKKLVVLDDDGVPHMRMTRDGRCMALEGALGRRVRCSVYHARPHACRRVTPGDADCERARSERLGAR